MKLVRRLLLALALIVAAVAATALMHRYGRRQTPVGQPPLLSLSADNFGAFTQAFNAAADRPRLVVLLSPT